MAILGSQRVWKPKFEKIAIFVWLSLIISNEIETFGGHISSTTAIWEVPLGFLDAPGFSLQKYIKIGKVPKIPGIAIFGWPSLRFSIKIETSGGHNSSTPWSWRLQNGFLDAPWIPLNKSIFSEKVTWNTRIWGVPGGGASRRGTRA